MRRTENVSGELIKGYAVASNVSIFSLLFLKHELAGVAPPRTWVNAGVGPSIGIALFNTTRI